MKTRNGKIARLPLKIRDVVNELLANGWPGNLVLFWLNQQPEVGEMLTEHFDGRPLTKQNLSQWRKGGYREWLEQRQQCDLVRQLTERATALTAAANWQEISARLSTLLSAELAQLAPMLIEKTKDPKVRWQRLREVLRATSELRRDEYRAGRLNVVQQRWNAQQEAEQAEKAGEQRAYPVFALAMEDGYRRLMGMGKADRRKAEEIPQNYFHREREPKASRKPRTPGSGQSQSKSVAVGQSGSK